MASRLWATTAHYKSPFVDARDDLEDHIALAIVREVESPIVAIGGQIARPATLNGVDDLTNSWRCRAKEGGCAGDARSSKQGTDIARLAMKKRTEKNPILFPSKT